MRTTAWITGILAITISLVAGSRPCFAIDTPDTGYQITSANRTIDVFGTCKQVRSSQSLFAPTKTSGEWNNFLNWGNSILTLSACASCSDGIQNQDETGVDCGGSCPACCLPSGTHVYHYVDPDCGWGDPTLDITWQCCSGGRSDQSGQCDPANPGCPNGDACPHYWDGYCN